MDSGCATLVGMAESKKRKAGRPKGSGIGRSRERGETTPMTLELARQTMETLERACQLEHRTKRAVIELALAMYFSHRGYIESGGPPPA